MGEHASPPGVEYLDHRADVGLRARGVTIEEAFERAAAGLFARMVGLDAVEPSDNVPIACRAETLPNLLVEWLGALLAAKDVGGVIFGRFDVAIAEEESGFVLRAFAWGEPLDPARHDPGVEVKGVSLLGLSVEQDGTDWVVTCVVDV